MHTTLIGPRAHRRTDLHSRWPQAAAVDELAASEERARIARELHDGVAQTLYAIGLFAAQALELVEDHEADQLEGLLGRVLELADDRQREVRALLTKSWADEVPAGGLIETLVG